MKHFIQGIKVGLTINLTIDGRLYKKSCPSDKTANDFFRAILKAKNNPNDQSVEELLSFMNQAMRIAKENGLEYDIETNLVYLPGFNTPIPNLLVKTIEDYHKNDFPIESIMNFWKLLMINPDKRVRGSLFDFIQTHDFSLTDNGYMVVYKSVDFFDEIKTDLNTFVTNASYHVRKDWKCSPSKYVVYQDNDDSYHITKETTFDGWDLHEKSVFYVGNLKDLEESSNKMSENSDAVSFIPHHVMWHKDNFDLEKERIKLGVPQKMKRMECDSNPTIDCSFGLHVGATKYVKHFGNSNSPILVCLVNPANVVAVPKYDHSKMRVSEYFPFALANRNNDGTIDVVEQSYFEHDYINYEKEELERQLKAIENEEERISVDSNQAEDDRTVEEIVKVLKTRVIEIS